MSHYSQVKAQVRGKSITVMRAPFAFGSKDFVPSNDLKNALIPAAQKSLSIRLRGRTDSDVADYINARIAQQRALSVKEFLIQNGANVNATTYRATTLQLAKTPEIRELLIRSGAK